MRIGLLGHALATAGTGNNEATAPWRSTSRHDGRTIILPPRDAVVID
jgi:hypothetical protein